MSAVEIKKLLGFLVATEKRVQPGRLHLRPFQRQVKKAIQKGRLRENTFVLAPDTVSDLQWWIDPKILNLGYPFHPPDHQLVMQTEAAKTS